MIELVIQLCSLLHSPHNPCLGGALQRTDCLDQLEVIEMSKVALHCGLRSVLDTSEIKHSCEHDLWQQETAPAEHAQRLSASTAVPIASTVGLSSVSFFTKTNLACTQSVGRGGSHHDTLKPNLRRERFTTYLELQVPRNTTRTTSSRRALGASVQGSQVRSHAARDPDSQALRQMSNQAFG